MRRSSALKAAADYAHYAQDPDDASTNVECAVAWALIAIAESVDRLTQTIRDAQAAGSFLP